MPGERRGRMILECGILCECDGCGAEDSFEIQVDHNGFDSFRLAQVLKGSNWKLVTNRRGLSMLCEACANKDDE
jgi:hypothetical protein